MRKPPTAATWVLRLLIGDADTLSGDLLEAFQSGRSRWWYWRQVIVIVIASMYADLRRHPIIALRAITLGLAFTWIVGIYIPYNLMHYDEWLFTTGLVRWTYVNGYGLPKWPIWPAVALMNAATGWIIGRSSREHGGSIVIAYAIAVELLIVGSGASHLINLPILVHSVSAVVTGALMQTLTKAIPALIGGVLAVHMSNRPRHAGPSTRRAPTDPRSRGFLR